MFMLAFIVMRVCGTFEWLRSCAGFYCLSISVLALDPINQFIYLRHISVSASNQDLDLQCHMTWYFLCSDL